jgi:hypothetical protein
MSHPEHTDHHGDGHGATTTQSRFTDTEWDQFQADDRQAGGAVLGLMAGIFTIGLVLYFGVFIWVGMRYMTNV